jgi:hypothetical protein
MSPANVSRKRSLHYSILFLLCFCLLSACTSGSNPSTGPASVSGSVSPTNSSVSEVPSSDPTVNLPDTGVAATIPVGPNPNVTVMSGSATQLTFIGSDTSSISTNLYALPYDKEGTNVIINFGQTIAHALEIKIPQKASLTINLTNGNLIVDSFNGQIGVTMTSGTIQIKNFTPYGTNTIVTQNGTIAATFTKNASCSLKAQTSFGAVVSGYTAISEKRTGMKAEASGTLNSGTGATVNLTTGYGSITIGPV